MALRIRKNGFIVCAAENEKEFGDFYIDDGWHYYLTVISKVLYTKDEGSTWVFTKKGKMLVFVLLLAGFRQAWKLFNRENVPTRKF
ncbi:MAG: hypothetical protein WC450_05290 [Candidatus Omnitrophota bacterium]